MTTPTPRIDRQTARRLAEGRETSPEILLAISAVYDTADETMIVAEWEEGFFDGEVVDVAKALRDDPEAPLYWGASGRIA